MKRSEQEIVIKLIEELNEAGVEGAKTANYGFVAYCEGKEWKNREKLEKECGDVLAMMAVCIANGVFTREGLRTNMESKLLNYITDDTFEHARTPICIKCYSHLHSAHECLEVPTIL